MTGLPITTERLVVRNWTEGDRELFHRINSDPEVMAFFPFRRNRAESDDLFDKVRRRIDQLGHGFMAVELTATGECIGFAGLEDPRLEPILPSGTTEIGWRLAPEFWRRGYATEAARGLLKTRVRGARRDEIVSFAVWNNDRSTAVMRRLGMKPDPSGDFDHPCVPDTHPHLKRHALYRLSREDWEDSRS